MMRWPSFNFSRLAWSLLIAALLAVVAAVGYRLAARQLYQAAAYGTASAIAAALVDLLQREPGAVEDVLAADPAATHRVKESEYDRLIAHLTPGYNLDPLKNWKPGEVLYDPWGRRYEIRLDRAASGSWRLISVRSFGLDGLPDTGDEATRHLDP